LPSRSTTDSDLTPLVDAWDELFAAIRRAKGRTGQQHDGAPSLSQFGLMRPLADAPEGMRIGELAESASISAPTASRMIDTLEKDGLVARRRSASDRRAVAITLTDHGRAMYEDKRALIDGKRDTLLRSLTGTERRHAVSLLTRMSNFLDEL